MKQTFTKGLTIYKVSTDPVQGKPGYYFAKYKFYIEDKVPKYSHYLDDSMELVIDMDEAQLIARFKKQVFDGTL